MEENSKSTLILIISVIVIILVTYFVTAFFLTGEIGNKKTSSQKDDEQTEERLSNSIIASNTFSMKESKYMVLFYSSKEISNSLKTIIANYDSSNSTKLYKVDINEAINKFVVGEEENKNAKSIEELSLKAPTIITIQNGNIIEYINNYDDILNVLTK